MNLITIREAAAIVKIKPQTLYTMINHQGIPVYRLGRKLIRIDEEEFLAWFKKQRMCTDASNKE